MSNDRSAEAFRAGTATCPICYHPVSDSVDQKRRKSLAGVENATFVFKCVPCGKAARGVLMTDPGLSPRQKRWLEAEAARKADAAKPIECSGYEQNRDGLGMNDKECRVCHRPENAH